MEKNNISFVHHNYFPTYTKVAFSCSGMHDVLLRCITTFLLNKRSLAKGISEKVSFFKNLGLWGSV